MEIFIRLRQTQMWLTPVRSMIKTESYGWFTALIPAVFLLKR